MATASLIAIITGFGSFCLAVNLVVMVTAVAALAPSSSSSSSCLFPYQQAGVERLVKDRRVLLADEMGLGKTVQAIGALNRLHLLGKLGRNNDDKNKKARILIVCPKSVLGVWHDELETWLDPNLNLQVHIATGSQSPEDEESSDGGGIIQLINYDICHKHRDLLQSRPYDVLICDEAHYLKSVGTKRTMAVLGSGVGGNDGIRCRYLWLLTGTPIMNRPIELYPLLRAIDPDTWGSLDEFAGRYCEPTRKGRWGKEANGATNLRELSEKLKPFMVRRYKRDVLTELPPKLRSCVSLDSSEAARLERERVAEMMAGDIRLMSSGGKGSNGYNLEDFSAHASGLFDYLGIPKHVVQSGGLSSERLLGMLAKIRQETALMKVRPAIQLLRDAILSHKVVVFAHHRALIQELVDEFGDVAVCIIGGMDTESRLDAVRRFQNDDGVRLFVGSIRAAGVGVTLTAASHVVFLELDWSPATMAQSEDRCHRVGQQDSVQVQYYVFRDTIDEFIAHQLLAKQDDIDRVLSTLETKSSSEEVYTMDFGKHRGLRIEDVPRDYLKYIVETDNGSIWKSRPALWRALSSFGLVHEKPPPAPSLTKPRQCCKDNVEYVFDFGKHRGKHWKDTPSSYRDWVIREQVWQSRSDLKDALGSAGLLEINSVTE